MDTKTIGRYALVAGVVLALVGAFTDLASINELALPILGLVAGFLYLSSDDATGYFILTAAVAGLGASLGEFFGIGTIVGDWLTGTVPMLGAGAVALILRTFYKWVMP